jgi:hypothetical protein
MDLAEHDRLLETLRADPARPVTDGPIVAERYARANPRILWILREHHGENGWDYREFVATDQALFRYRGWTKTLGPVAIVSHGLLRGRIPWGDWAADPSKLTDSLRDTAIVNFNKEGGGTHVTWKAFLAAAVKYGETIGRQVQYLDPHIVICAGTFGIVLKATGQLSFSEEVPTSSTVSNGRVYVCAHHPNQRRLTQRAYYEGIRDDIHRLLPSEGSS